MRTGTGLGVDEPRRPVACCSRSKDIQHNETTNDKPRLRQLHIVYDIHAPRARYEDVFRSCLILVGEAAKVSGARAALWHGASIGARLELSVGLYAIE